MRLDKPIGIFLLLWPTLMALWIAGEGKPNLYIVSIFVLGVIVMRSAGCVINDWADRNFDKAVTRTRNRPLAMGTAKPREAILLFLFLISIALILVLQLNLLAIALSIVALLLATAYPFMKRYTHLPQVALGIAFAWAIPMAFVAITHQLSSSAMLLFLATVCWTVAYDTEYAMVDRADDIQIGVKSMAILLGKADRLVIGGLQLGMLVLLVILGWDLGYGKCYYLGICGASVLAFYQQYLIKNRIPEQCFKAFLNNNLLGALLFSGLVLEGYYG